MATNISKYREQVLEEIDKTPMEHLPHLLQIIRIFRESITLKSSEESFKQGWFEALRGETKPVSELWEGIDAE
ncbi:hypothetical protein GWN26_08850 [Candidatus Saccharibacteria bacterium]|nr:hypothetical protein [Calditrichia bacterium]NIV71365.1 hypothetical protein [Calditrichia bacterium]NIV99230.1 hypothetical protein [Candidatus Saccharibacteria bacterium]NIW78173.1 hypothetical protein [Calditrichia bacterium]